MENHFKVASNQYNKQASKFDKATVWCIIQWL